MHELVVIYDGASPLLRHVTSGHVWVGQASFAPAIARCYLVILSIEYDLSQKLDLEAVAIVASYI